MCDKYPKHLAQDSSKTVQVGRVEIILFFFYLIGEPCESYLFFLQFLGVHITLSQF